MNTNSRYAEFAGKTLRRMSRTKKRNLNKIAEIITASRDKRFPPMYEVLPQGECGGAKIEHFEIDTSRSVVTRLRAEFNPDTRWYTFIPPGKYARLSVDGVMYMTDTGHEHYSSLPLLNNAYGNVLVSGLGLGMVIPPLLANPKVDSVCVVEKNTDVVRLVLPPLLRYIQAHTDFGRSRDLCVSKGDVWNWDPYADTLSENRKFDTIFHDIWPNLGPELLPEFAKLKRRYRKWLNKGGWMGCWAEETCRQLSREKRRELRERHTMIAAIGGDPLAPLSEAST